MKSIFLFFVFTFFCFAQEIPKDFLDRFETYKQARIAKNAKVLYNLQVPYFKYLNRYKDYKYYVNAMASAKNIKITNFIKKNANFFRIIVGLKVKNKKNMIYLEQSWYRIKDNYYLLPNDDIIFRY